ncbi:Choline dehydrogenase or related flavoprotein [Geosmithia morbida]|uniref:Choline dehydrogenase or related flavoprotein n=1 Tax=Geosmithia morbida TaxID=1094350 RepID=A0A9P5D2E4_9HYPO|nr:Choline dehydrogenase or related flavoprotein [Geosmithia morbida]KAF4121396.1 Choline dehydrogenase or related flavoprotein [Geosmithia morbida]
MVTVTQSLSANAADAFDYVIVGGGTAGCVIASRLSAYLPERRVLVIEGGPSDLDLGNVLDLRQWLSLLGGDLDYDYGTTEQPMGNSHIRHSRAKVLGGCSSHNTLISFRPFRHDMERWEAGGCDGWSFDNVMRHVDNLRNSIQPVHARHRNQLCKDWVESTSQALDIPVIHDFNHEISNKGQLNQGVGFFSVSYNPDNGHRSSASVAYIHPILKGEERRPNLTLLTEAMVSKLHVKDGVASGVDVTLKDGQRITIKARKETILCAGAVDTPRLLLHSGIGPRDQLEALGIPVVADVPGVGENLLDHPETIIMWELNKPVPENQTTMDSDAGVFLRREAPNAAGNDGDAADIMMHCYQIPFTLNTGRLGYPEIPDRYAFCMTPNIPRPRSRGRIYLTSADPTVKPALDFRYFTDPEGYDAATFVAGIKAARKIAEQAPFKDWLKKEVAPGPKIQSDEDISEYARRVAHTVYHPAGTTKMGDVTRDEKAVVDPKLKFRGIGKLRIADAGIFPDMPSINPMVTVLAIGERAAELIAMDDGWKGDTNRSRL